MSILPIALVSPHAALEPPPELAERSQLTPAQIFNEADAHINTICNFSEQALYWHSFPYARALVDVNRPARAEAHFRPGDGVVKLRTSYGAEVYPPGAEPSATLVAELIERYWQPWHAKIEEICRDPAVKLIVDCHSMAATGPSHYSDPGRPRPKITVGNLGNKHGLPRTGFQKTSAPAALAQRFRTLLARHLGRVPALVEVDSAVRLNTPFFGGWDLRLHTHHHTPILMIELNRGLYVGHQTGDSPPVALDPERLAELREGLWAAITELVAEIG